MASARRTKKLSFGSRCLLGASLVLALFVGANNPAAWATDTGGTTTNGAVPPVSRQNDRVALRIAGDDILASTIVVPIARNYLERRGARAVRVAAAAAPWTTEISGRLLNGDRVAVLVRSSSTEDGFRQLADGTIDIALAGRKISPEEVRDIPSRRDTVDRTASLAMARVAVVAAVHPMNRVKTITLQQLRDIYAGKLTDWRELGGTPGEIHVFSRQMGSTDSNLFDSAVMGTAPVAQTVRQFPTFAAMREALRSDRNGIGYLAVPKGLKALGIDVRGQVDVSPPGLYELASGDYPVSEILLFYRRLGSENSEASAFFREAVSVSSRVAILSAGLSGLAPQLIFPESFASSSDAYQVLTRNSLRVSTTIRFADGSTEIDAVTGRALDALSLYLRRLQVHGDKLIHIAFSEDTGDPKENIIISERLGKIVISELRKRRVVTGDVVPLGAEEPIGSESTPVGRGLNRRVETWIRP
ncbi:MAG TPA: substrate-binding domain-containing protein [Steroidobacteraceae bacterium]|nr:substrate-binding domain-containing protein [Steroidobacteraceae bacterium]